MVTLLTAGPSLTVNRSFHPSSRRLSSHSGGSFAAKPDLTRTRRRRLTPGAGMMLCCCCCYCYCCSYSCCGRSIVEVPCRRKTRPNRTFYSPRYLFLRRFLCVVAAATAAAAAAAAAVAVVAVCDRCASRNLAPLTQAMPHTRR